MRDDELFFDPADAEKLRRGWPYALVLDESHKDNKRAAAATTSFIEAIDPKYFTVMPAEVARRFLRTGCVTQFRPRPGLLPSQAMTARTQAAITDGGPISPDEALALLREALRASREIYEFKVSTFLFTVEQLAGSEATVAALCDGFEELVAEQKIPWRGSVNFPYWCAFLLHWPLLRVSREARDKARDRIDAVIEAAEARTRESSDWHLGTTLTDIASQLDLSVHGAAAYTRRCRERVPNSIDVLRVDDDPDLVLRQCAAAPGSFLHVRFVLTGGVGVLDGLHRRKWPARYLPSILRDFGMIRAPEVVDLMLSRMSVGPKSGQVMGWLIEHADYCRPLLQARTEHPDLGASARAALMLIP